MIEWFQNVWQWLVDNWPSILLFFTSQQAISLVVAVVSLWRQAKAIKAADQSTKQLNGSVDVFNSATKLYQENLEAFTNKFIGELNTVVSGLNAIGDAAKNALIVSEQNKQKTDAIIDALQIAYSTIKDDTVRKAVSDVLVNAKLSDNRERTELLETIAGLKQQVESYSKAMAESVEAATKVVEEKITPESVQTEVKPIVLRG